jgi:flagellar basal body rod protein FlgC
MSVTSIAHASPSAPLRRLETPVRTADSPSPAARAEQAHSPRMFDLVRFAAADAKLSFNPLAASGDRNGMVMAPNADLLQEQAAPFAGYNLAFNAPIMHMYSRTTKSIVNLLA